MIKSKGMETFVITEFESNQRIDKYLRKCLNNTPLSLIYKTFRKKDVKVNEKRVKQDYIVQTGDVVKVYLPNKTEEFIIEKEYQPVKRNFDILYEDENILAVNKPVGVLVHDDENQHYNTLTNQVISYLIEKQEYNPRIKGFTPAPAHRLDRNTSGIVLFAKNMEAIQSLNEAFKEKDRLEKYYLALVCGKTEDEGSIECLLKKDEKTGMVKVVKQDGLTSKSIYKTIESNGKYSLVEVHLLTGRTHQIRVHFAHISHPVIGDKKYGNFQENSYFEKEYNWENQFLHAYKIKFVNLSGKLSYLNKKIIENPLPKDKNLIILSIFR